jgi:outer membrane protein, adhesin transport system
LKIIRACSFFVVAFVLVLPNANAETLSDMLRSLSENHAKIRGAEAELAEAKHDVKSSYLEWLPTVTLTADVAHDQTTLDSATATATNINPDSYDVEVKLNQTIWDFGVKNSAIDSVLLTQRIRELELASEKQELVADGAKAYISLYKFHKTWQFASQSVENIKRQTGLEEIRVRKGAGITTDVLKSKGYLRTAEARMAKAAGKLQNAKTDYLRYFKTLPEDFDSMQSVGVKTEETQLEELTADAVRNSYKLLIADLKVKVNKEKEFKANAKGFYPVIDLTADMALQNNTGSNAGYRTSSVTLKAKLPIDGFGLSTISKTKAEKSKTLALREKYQDIHEETVSDIRKAWQDFETAQTNAAILSDRVSIENAFLERARKERLLGTRSLLDVLKGEIDLIDAQSGAQSAQEDLTIALIEVFLASGRLSPDVFAEDN